MKKAWKYISITFLLLLGLCCVGILYLFFVPNSHLFGIAYVNNNSLIKSEKRYSSDDVSQIVMNSRSYNVEILPSKNNNYSVEVFSNSFGFVLTKNENCKINESLKNGILTFNIEETYGFALDNNSYIYLYVPADTAINLKLTNKNATTTIDSTSVFVNNLSYSTSSGDFNFKTGTLNGTLDLSLNKSIFTISEAVETNSNKVNLKLTSGRFDAKKEVLGDIELQENKNGVISVQECLAIRENQSSAGGQIYINKLSHINVFAGDTIIEVGAISDGAIVTLTKSGRFKVETLRGISEVITNSGSISVNNCESSSTFHSDSGNISIKNAKKTISIKTNTGDASVIFAEDAEHFKIDEEDNSRTLFATIKNGNLFASGVEHFGVPKESSTTDIEGITITGTGTATIHMSDVCGENKVNGNNGSVKIITNATSRYLLTTSSNSGNIRVNLLQISDSYGYTTIEKTITEVNGSNPLNSLTASTNKGTLTILDSVINEYGF